MKLNSSNGQSADIADTNKIEDIKNLLNTYKTSYDFINRKKCFKLINKKKNRKNRSRQTSNNEVYKSKLASLLKNETLFGNDLGNQNKDSPDVEVYLNYFLLNVLCL